MIKLKSVPNEAELKNFVDRYSWRKQMDRASERGSLDSWSNYGGEDLGDIVVVVGRNRDSDMLDESNFETALEILGGESETVEIHRFGHWGCGWFELLTVDASDTKALIAAYEIKKSLEDYPVLDDSDYSERQTESFADYAEQVQDDLARALIFHLGLPEDMEEDPDVIFVAFQLNMECQYQYGEDYAINVYETHEPEPRDIERVRDCLKHMFWSSQRKENPFFEYLCLCLDVKID